MALKCLLLFKFAPPLSELLEDFGSVRMDFLHLMQCRFFLCLIFLFKF